LRECAHLGIFDADAAIFRHTFAQSGRSGLGHLYILRFDLLGCFQVDLHCRVALAHWLRLKPTLYRCERRQHDCEGL
jgi:hypothetical protein